MYPLLGPWDAWGVGCSTDVPRGHLPGRMPVNALGWPCMGKEEGEPSQQSRLEGGVESLPRYPVLAGQFGLGDALGHLGADLLYLLGRQGPGSADLLPGSFRCVHTFLAALVDDGHLELSDCPEHLEEQGSHGVRLGSREGQSLFMEPDGNAFGDELGDELLKVDKVPGKAVNAMHVQNIPVPAELQALGELHPVSRTFGRHLLLEPLVQLDTFKLAGGVLTY